MEQLQHVYENLKDYHEIAIIEKYGESAKRFTGATASETYYLLIYVTRFIFQVELIYYFEIFIK